MSDPTAESPLRLIDHPHAPYSLCLPARMAEADPRLRTVARQFQAALNTASSTPFPVTAERTARSIFLLIDLDSHRPAKPPPAYAVQTQGQDLLISGKDACGVAGGIAWLLETLGFRLTAGGQPQPPAAAVEAGRLTWSAADRVEIDPAPNRAWLAYLLPAD